MTDPLGPSTQELVEQARTGNQRAYDALFRRVGDRLLFYIRLRLGPELRKKLELEDILQETYLEAHRSFASFRSHGERDFTRWLYRIVENLIRNKADHFGAQKRKAAKGVDSRPEVLRDLLSYDTGPSTAFARSEQHERLAQVLAGLEDDEREALLLKYLQEMTVEEVAKTMGRSKSATQRLLARGTARLGAMFRQGNHPPD